jgi:hypothetical protein
LKKKANGEKREREREREKQQPRWRRRRFFLFAFSAAAPKTTTTKTSSSEGGEGGLQPASNSINKVPAPFLPSAGSSATAKTRKRRSAEKGRLRERSVC